MNEHNFVIAALVALAHAYEPVGAPTLQRVLTRLHAHLHARIGMPVDLHTITARLLIAALEARPGDAAPAMLDALTSQLSHRPVFEDGKRDAPMRRQATQPGARRGETLH